MSQASRVPLKGMPPVTQLCSSRPRLTLGLQYSLADMRHWIRLSSTTKKANKKIIYIKHKLWGAYRAKLFILQQKFSRISNRTFLSWDISYRWITESGLKCFKVRCFLFRVCNLWLWQLLFRTAFCGTPFMACRIYQRRTGWEAQFHHEECRSLKRSASGDRGHQRHPYGAD